METWGGSPWKDSCQAWCQEPEEGCGSQVLGSRPSTETEGFR